MELFKPKQDLIPEGVKSTSLLRIFESYSSEIFPVLSVLTYRDRGSETPIAYDS